MGWVATAIIGSAVIGAGASIAGASAQADATASASRTQADATKYSTDVQKDMYDQTREDQEPWRLAGIRALETIQNTPDFEFNAENFMQMKDPSYEWRVDQGVKAMDKSATARGNLFSGAAAKALTEYGQNMGSQEYQNAYNRARDTYMTNMNTQKSLAGVGQDATNMVSQAGQNMASGVASTTMSGANNQANLAIQGGQNQANMYSNLAQSANTGVSNYLMYSMIK